MKSRNNFLALLLVSLFLVGGDYADHIVELEQYEGRNASLEKKMREQIKEMHSTKDKALIQTLAHEIVKNHEEIKKNIRRANKTKNHIRFEHPEKGVDLKLKFQRLDENRLKELEKELGLDQILTELNKK